MPQESPRYFWPTYSENMVSHHMSHWTRDPSSYPISSGHWENFCRCVCTSLQDTTQKVMAKQNRQTRSWSNICRYTQTTNRMIGQNCCPLQNSPTTMLPTQPQEYLHSLPIRDITQNSPWTCRLQLHPWKPNDL